MADRRNKSKRPRKRIRTSLTSYRWMGNTKEKRPARDRRKMQSTE